MIVETETDHRRNMQIYRDTYDSAELALQNRHDAAKKLAQEQIEEARRAKFSDCNSFDQFEAECLSLQKQLEERLSLLLKQRDQDTQVAYEEYLSKGRLSYLSYLTTFRTKEQIEQIWLLEKLLPMTEEEKSLLKRRIAEKFDRRPRHD
jgi:predicted ATPase